MNPTTKPPSPPTTPGSGWIGPEHMKNRALVPASELQPWIDKHVAWTWEGTRIIAGAETLGALIDELHRMGVDTSTVVFSYIDVPGATYL